MSQLGDTFDDLFGDKGKFAQIIKDTFGENGSLVKQIFDPSREGTPLYELRVELERQIRGLQDRIGERAAVQAVVERTPLHGLEFEEQVKTILSNIVRQRKGDTLEGTGTLPGRVTRSKKGDFVVRFHEKPDAALVIEAKDEAGISLPEIQRTLKEAMENRGAVYSILVSKSVAALPSSVGWFNEFFDNQLVVAIGEPGFEPLREEILNIALTWARFKILLQTARQGSLDITKIAGAVQKAESALGRFREILTQCTNLDRASQEIRNLCTGIRQDIQTELTTISRLVNNPQT